MSDKHESIPLARVKMLLDTSFPEYRVRVVHGKNLHTKDVQSLISDMTEYSVSYNDLAKAIEKLLPYCNEIHSEHRSRTLLEVPGITSFEHDKMYRVGIARVLLDITHSEFRKRHTKTDLEMKFLDKWLKVYSTNSSI
ncbi:MAG TPA: hypothetical protein VIN07_10335 [Flavipsychrobacter sp.]